MRDPWGSNHTRTFAQVAEHTDNEHLLARIRDVKLNKVSEDGKRYKAVAFLQPLRKRHLYSEFKEGVNAGGRADNVWLFGTIGCFVFILACINFMNLSTARSDWI